MPFLVDLGTGLQARAHSSCGKCKSALCPCKEGMVSASWAYRRYGGRAICELLAKNWIFRFKARKERIAAEEQLARSRRAILRAATRGMVSPSARQEMVSPSARHLTANHQEVS